MKNYIWVIALFLPWICLTQTVTNIDFASPVEDGYAAVRKGNLWGFINKEGVLVIPFRSDLVANEKPTDKVDLGVASLSYPAMIENRSIITTLKDGIPYYGFIDQSGKTVIEPQFLNVSTFQNGLALALKLKETVLGSNEPLGKRIVSYDYDVVLINYQGEVTKYLAGPFHISLSPEKLKTAPPIVAKDISENLIAVRMPNNQWSIFKLE